MVLLPSLAITPVMVERVQWVFRRRTSHVARPTFVADIETAVAKIDADVAPRLKLTAATEPPPRMSLIPFSSLPAALVSIETPDATALHARAIEAELDRMPSATFESFGVTTSVPVELPVEPKVGAVTPGVELLTLFRRKPGLDDATLIERWHGGHTPLSLEIHPLWGYIRNVVKTRWPDNATPLDGIVEEYFETQNQLLNPSVFFKGPILMVPNMIRVAWDIYGFIDMKTIETYWVSERWLRYD